MKVALYARVSDPREKRDTIDSQIDALRAHAQATHHDVAESYVCRDHYTGTELARPELDRLRDGAYAGAFDAVLVHHPDRLSRKYAHLILLLEEFERLAIPVIFVTQPPSDDPHALLLVQIQGAVAEYERTKITERYRRGKLYRARQGEIVWNSIPYGYRRIPRQDSSPAHLVVDEAQAAVVRQVFAWHADDGMTIRQIARRLTREGYPTPRGGAQWGETTVHRIVRREAYLGVLHYNTSCRTPVPSPDGGARRRRRSARPPSEWIAISIPPLIDPETFARSQARHGPNQQFSPRNLHQERWLLRRLVRCGTCGVKCACVGDTRRRLMPSPHYYRCGPPRLPGRPRCRPCHIRTPPLDAFTGQMRDITERRRIEAESRKLRDELAHLVRVHTLGELTSSLTHEINQPLTAIANNANTSRLYLEQEPLDRVALVTGPAGDRPPGPGSSSCSAGHGASVTLALEGAEHRSGAVDPGC